jgi:phospholipase A1/A2
MAHAIGPPSCAALTAALTVAAFWPSAAAAQLSACAKIPEDAVRLACYDQLAQKELTVPTPTPPPPLAEAKPLAASATVMEQRWELRPDLQRGAFNLLPYKPVYGLVHWMSDPNERPQSPTRAVADPIVELDRLEAKFQLSFKTKVAEGLLGTPADLWFGYTQVAFWQVFNRRFSSPFRETNYEPEAMLIWPLQIGVGEFRMRFVGLTLNHQSNGRGGAFSRSWDRAIGEAAAEYGRWSFHVRPWTRVFGPRADRDHNPDIEDFAGRGELITTWRGERHVLTFSGRHSLRGGARSRGGAQLDWAFPIAGALNGRVQVFHGYGLNLIDYNHRQTTVGVGLSFFD